MNQQSGREEIIRCRVARGRFPALLAAENARAVPPRHPLSAAERTAAEGHLRTCAGCAAEYRLQALSRAVIDTAAAVEPVVPLVPV